MKPSKHNILIILSLIAGLIVTQGCGGSSSSSGGTSSSGSAGGGVTISNEVSSPADMAVGDIIMLQFTSSASGQFDFSGVSEDSQYYLAVGSLDSGSGSHLIQVAGDLSELEGKSAAEVAYEEESWEEWGVAEALDQRFRNVEMAIAADPEMEIADSAPDAIGMKAALAPKAGAVGDTEEFRVLNSLTSVSSYATVTGRIKCVGDNVIVYLDTEVESVNPDDLTDSDIDALCSNFDDQVALERSWFGDESDVNGDGKVAALLTPQVNRLGSLGGGIITGFFLATDLYTRTGSNGISNEREIVYTMVPDSDGDYGLVISKSFSIENLLTAVLPHEFQHAISYNQHVFEGEGSPESNWLNEGLSHLAEDLVGYGQENYSRADIYLNSTSSYQLAGSGSPGLGARGASYLFMRFLHEQHSDPASFLWGLYHNNVSGVTNVETAYAGTSDDFNQFGEFFLRWMVALAMTDRGLSTDTRYVYEPRTYNSRTSRWQGICLVCDAGDGRGTAMTGPSVESYSSFDSLTLNSSAAKFYSLSNVSGTVTLNSSSTGTYGASLIRKQ